MNSPIVGGIARVMAAQREGTKIKDFASAGMAGSADALPTSNEAVLRLARLIGRQIAREEFDRQEPRKRVPLRQKSRKPI